MFFQFSPNWSSISIWTIFNIVRHILVFQVNDPNSMQTFFITSKSLALAVCCFIKWISIKTFSLRILEFTYLPSRLHCETSHCFLQPDKVNSEIQGVLAYSCPQYCAVCFYFCKSAKTTLCESYLYCNYSDSLSVILVPFFTLWEDSL